MDQLLHYGLVGLSVLVGLFVLFKALGFLTVGEDQVGIVTKNISMKNLPAGQVIATNGEAGIQAKTLSPGLHLFYYPFIYEVQKVPLVTIAPGKLGLVSAIDGKQLTNEQILAKPVDSNHFQDALAFLSNGGEKGKQMAMLTAGKYRINTALFNVQITDVTQIPADTIGIVTTYDGQSLSEGEIAGKQIPDHNNFQDIQIFLKAGGKRGLQEQVILSGSWNLNPWFVSVQGEKMVNVPIAHVGVVTSYVGKAHEDISGESFKHGDLVNPGHKGVWATPLYPGLHPINTKTTKVELVPTANVVLNWATNRNEAHQLDKNLSSITVRSKDGFSYNLDVSVVIHVGAKEAARVISRMGSMLGLISQVLEPTIGNYFRNSAQEYAALDFLKTRSEMQKKAAEYVHAALKQYDVEAVDTLIGDIVLPAELLTTQTERKLAEEMKLTYEIQETSQKQKESLNKQTAITQMQASIVASEQGVKIAQLEAEQKVKAAEGDTKVAEQQALQKIRLAEGDAAQIQKKAFAEAEGIKAKGNAQAEAYKNGVSAMGEGNFTLLETMTTMAKEKMKIIPDLMINGGGSSGGAGNGIVDVLMAQMVKDKLTLDHKKTDEKVE